MDQIIENDGNLKKTQNIPSVIYQRKICCIYVFM